MKDWDVVFRALIGLLFIVYFGILLALTAGYLTVHALFWALFNR